MCFSIFDYGRKAKVLIKATHGRARATFPVDALAEDRPVDLAPADTLAGI
jgi:hypothetical protein